MSDTTDIAVRDDRAMTIAEPTNLLAALVEISARPDVNPEMFSLLCGVQERAEAKQAERFFNESMNAAQLEITPVIKTAKGDHDIRYAKLEHIDDMIRPIYLKHGFTVKFTEGEPSADGQMKVCIAVKHVGGHTESNFRYAPADTAGPKGNATKTILHGKQSTETFLKRALMCDAFNIVYKNQDDNGAMGGKDYVNQATLDQMLAYLKQVSVAEADLCRALNLPELEHLETKRIDEARSAVREILAARKPAITP